MQKLSGIGPAGTLVSLTLLAIAVRVDRSWGHPQIFPYPSVAKAMAVLLVCTGSALHFRTMHALRNRWNEERPCMKGPFR